MKNLINLWKCIKKLFKKPDMISTPIGFYNSFDPDALRFITVTGISDDTQKNAINQLVKDLKNDVLWSKFQAIYPVIGGTAGTHKYNLIDPRDEDTAFRLDFTSHWSHTSNGMTPDGIADFANTHFVPDGNLVDRDDSHFCIYSRSDVMAADQQDLGCGVSTVELMIKPGTAVIDFQDGRGAGNQMHFFFINTLGLIFMTREGLSDLKAYQNTNWIGSAVGPHFVGLNTRKIYLGAANDDGVADNFSTRQLAFASIGTSMDSSEESLFYDIVQNYQTTLGREV